MAVGLLAAGAAAAGALAHPITPLGAALGALLVAAACAWASGIWMLVLGALLPLAATVPWAGFYAFDDADLLIASCIAGAALRIALRPVPPLPRAPGEGSVPSRGALVLAALWAASVAAATLIGLQAAGGVGDLGGGWRSGANVLRLAKATPEALLLWALWCHERRTSAQAGWMLARGMALAVTVIGAVVLWERLAFSALTDFSADYRALGPFWEMHVGGASLDAALALAWPFALWLLRRGRGADIALGAAGSLLGIHALLATLSRVAFGTMPAIVLVMVLFEAGLQRLGPSATFGMRRSRWPFGSWMLVVAAAAALQFPGGGYRGLLVVAGCAAIALLAAPAWVDVPRRRWPLAMGGGLALGAVGWVLAGVLPKGPYVVAGAFLVAGVVAGVGAGQSVRPRAAAALAAWVLYVANAVMLVCVARYWGLDLGLSMSLVPAALLVAWPWLQALARRRPAWPDTAREQLMFATVGGAMLLAVGVLLGGSQMAQRGAMVASDVAGREAHVEEALALRHTATQQLLGIGIGRYVDEAALAAPSAQRPGDLRWLTDADGRRFVRLQAGRHVLGFGELLRLMQRIDHVEGPLRVALEVRAARPVAITAEVCRRHVLYPDGCRGGTMRPPPAAGWQRTEVALQGEGHGHPWFDPFGDAFALAVTEPPGGFVDIRAISLRDASGRERIANASLAAGPARWFMTSDRHHMPWHEKNLAAHLLVGQGWVGLAVFTALALTAVAAAWRARRRTELPMAALAAAVAGVFVVGLIDSIIDAPRIALLVLWLMLVAAGERAAPRRVTAAEAHADAAAASRAMPKPMPAPLPRAQSAALLLAMAALLAVLTPLSMRGRSPVEWVRGLDRSAQDWPSVAFATRPLLDAARRLVYRPVPTLPLDALGAKGQRAVPLPPQPRDAQGLPQPLPADPEAWRTLPTAAAVADTITVVDVEGLRQAIASARAGQRIELMPGVYDIGNATLQTANPGAPAQPIVVGAARPGTVTIRSGSVQAFVVSQPGWQFENLEMLGACSEPSDCEHAFHVVGAARGTVLRNLRLVDFNAAIKVNAEGGKAPDDGLVQFVTMANRGPRSPWKPLTMFDLVAASRWTVADSAAANFVRTAEVPSYGLFMKGGGEGGRFLRNLVVCALADPPPGASEGVGISFGGGRTGEGLCREGACGFEHRGGVMASNVVAHCDGAGLDVNHSVDTLLLHNTVIHSGAVLARDGATVVARGNAQEAPTIVRGGATLRAVDATDGVAKAYPERDRLVLRPGETASLHAIGDAAAADAAIDFCGRPRRGRAPAGALAAGSDCLAQPAPSRAAPNRSLP